MPNAQATAAMPVPRDLRSIAAMYLLHGLNIGLPLITIPFLTRSLGAQQYGAYGLILSWIAISAVLIEFGYGVSGTKRLHDGADQLADDVAGRVALYQCLHAVLVLPILALAVWFSSADATLSPLAMGLLLVAAWLLGTTTLWFHVAQATVAQLLAPTLATKSLSLLLTVVALPLLPSLELALAAYLAANLWVLVSLNDQYSSMRRQWRLFVWRDFVTQLRISAPIPMQRLGTMLYTYLPTAMAAVWFGLSAAGWYFLADRIVRGVIGLFTPLTAHLLPKQIAAYKGERTADRSLTQMLAAVLLVALAATVMLALLAEPICRLLGGIGFAAAAPMLIWLAPLTVLVTANALLLNHLYAANAQGAVAWVVWGCAALYLPSVFSYGRTSLTVFAALSMLVEAAVLLCFIALVRRSRRVAA